MFSAYTFYIDELTLQEPVLFGLKLFVSSVSVREDIPHTVSRYSQWHYEQKK